MKTIYTFTFTKFYYDLEEHGNKLRLLAYMLYDSIYNYYGDDNIPLDMNENIVYNQIHNDVMNSVYRFDSEVYHDDNYVNYEPFLIGENSFALTIVDENFELDIIEKLLEQNMRLLGLTNKIVINSFKYETLDNSDECNREKAIRKAYETLGCKQKKSGFFGIFAKNSKPNRNSSPRR